MFTDDSLLAADFDPAQYLRHALQVSSTSFDNEQLRLSRCLEKIETEIHATVQTHRDALIGSVQEVGAAQRTTNAVLHSVDGLQSSVRRMRHTVHEPYVLMEQRVHELRNVHACLSLVRNVQRYLSVASKVKEAAQGDLVRAARLLKEVEEIQGTCDLTGIPFVDDVAPGVNHAANAIRQRLSEALRNAIATANPGELAVSLQCAASMNSLAKTVQGVMAEIKREASRALVKELDNASSSFGSEMDAAFRDAIFAALENALGQVAGQLRAFGLLWTVLRKRRDPATDAQYWWQLPNSDRRAFDTVWTAILNQIKERLSKLAKRGSVLVAVSSDYGRLTLQLRGFMNLVRETLSHVHFDGEDVDDSLMNATVDDLVARLAADFEPRFRLSLQDRLRERMSGLINKLGTIRPSQGVESTPIDVRADIRIGTTGGGAGGAGAASGGAGGGGGGSSNAARNAPALVVHPVAAAVDPKSFFKTVTNEIAAARSDDAVLAVVLRAVCDEIESFSRRCADMLKTLPVPELPRVSAGATTAAQVFHVQVANGAMAFVLEMQSASTMFPVSHKSAALDRVVQSFNQLAENLSRFATTIVQPYFAAASIVLLQGVDSFVHDYYERGVSRPQKALGAAVTARINDFAARYALLFDARAGTVAARACHSLADKLLQRFVARLLLRRGVAAYRPGGANEQIRRCVAEDCAAMQDAVNVLHPLDRLARRLSQLRAVRSLALATSEEAFDATVAEYVAAKFHPAVLLLSALQCIPAAASPGLASHLKVTPQQLATLLEALLSSSPNPDVAVVDTPSLSQIAAAGAATAAGGGASSGAGVGDVGAGGARGGVGVPWDSSKWTVLWEAANAVVADVERAISTAAAGEAPLCEPSVARRARMVVDAVRM